MPDIRHSFFIYLCFPVYKGIIYWNHALFKLFPFPVHPENALKPSVCIDFDHYNSG